MASLTFYAAFLAVAVSFACAPTPGSDADTRSPGGEAGSGVSGRAGGEGATPSSGAASLGEGGTGIGGMGGSPAVSGNPGSNGGTDGGTAATGAGGSSSNACGSAGQPGSFEQQCAACATGSCELCLCRDCAQPLEVCASTPGCPDIVACTRQSGCLGASCYCGSSDPVSCLNGQSNGPCKDVILEAPGSRVPNLVNSSAGPASDAAVAIAACTEKGQPCAEACASK